jgi:hypothetical protein
VTNPNVGSFKRVGLPDNIWDQIDEIWRRLTDLQAYAITPQNNPAEPDPGVVYIPIAVVDTPTVDLTLNGMALSADVVVDGDPTHFLNGVGGWAVPAGGGPSGYNPDTPPASPSAYDDEFGGTTLDGKWTAINCAAGTVDLLASDPLANGIYDLTMFPGNIALQPVRDGGNNPADNLEDTSAMIQQTVDLATNCKLVSKVNLGCIPSSDITYYSGIVISGGDGFNDDNFLAVCSIGGLGAGTFNGTYIFGNLGGTPFSHVFIEDCPYLMILKTDTEFRVFVSNSGKAWIDHAGATYALGLTTGVLLRAFVYFGRTSATWSYPFSSFDFVRYFANNTPRVDA